MASRITNWARHYTTLRRQQEQANAEGQHRPAPGLTPPLTEDEWIDAQIEALEEPTP